ncbi:MAG: hypothetical protein ACLU0O_00880 [Collinsella sp.]
MRHINHACVGDPLYGKCDARADEPDRAVPSFLARGVRSSRDGERIECRDSCRGISLRFSTIWLALARSHGR